LYDTLTSIGTGAIDGCTQLSTIYTNNVTYINEYLSSISRTGVNVLEIVIPCFLEGTQILTNTGYKTIESIRKGDLIKTYQNDYVPVELIGKSKIYNPKNNVRYKNRLYKYDKYNLYITGCHSVLVKDITDKEREDTINEIKKIYKTDDHYRLLACLDKNSEPYECEGLFTIYHLALENEEYTYNYGIYANGLLVESFSLRYLKELSGMELI